MHSGVDPAATLGQQYLPVVRSDSVRVGIPNELGLAGGEVFQEQSCQVTILSQMQQVLHVERVDPVFRIIMEELGGDEEGFVGIGSA